VKSSADTGESGRSIPLDQRHPDTLWVTRRLQLHLDAVREILRDFMPHAREIDEKHLSVDALFSLKDLSPSRRDEVRAFMDRRIADARAGDPPQLGDGESSDDEEDSGESTVSISMTLGEIEEVTGDRHFASRFIAEFEKSLQGPLRVTILHNSLLAMAVGAFEVLVSGIATRFYIAHPDALDSDEKTFSFAELRAFGDVNDAADEMISRRIADLMYGGLGTWADWFDKNCNARLSEIAMNFDSVEEAFQRRHVVLHNGGLASRQYLRHVPGSSVEVGDRLPVDASYLDAVFDELDVLGTSLGVLADGTWRPEGRDDAAGVLLRRSYELMVEERWAAAGALARLGRQLTCEAATKTSLQCNEWLCRAEQSGYDSIQSEVDADFDASHMSGRFKLVRSILIGQLDEAVAAVPEAVESKEITRGELEAWPIFRRVREHPDYADLLSKLDAVERAD
jgi:hypothetical protein